MIYSRSSNIIHSATSSLYSSTNIFQFHPPSSPWQPPFCSLFLWVWLFFLLQKNDAIQCSPFPVWLISLSIVTSRLLHVFTMGKISSFLMARITFYWVIFHIFLSMHQKQIISKSWQLWTWKCIYLFEILILFPLIYIQKLLNYMMVLFFKYLRNLHTAFHMAILVYFLVNSIK